MPDLIRVARQIENYPWQFVVRIGEDKNTQCLLHRGELILAQRSRSVHNGKIFSLVPLRRWWCEAILYAVSFKDFGLSPEVVRGTQAMGFTEPTPIQLRAFPIVLAGKD